MIRCLKLRSLRSSLRSAFIALFSCAGALAPAGAAEEIVPLIVIDDVPLVDAIKNLARQVGGNYILDPRLQSPAQAGISLRQTNATAYAALSSVLKEHKLMLVTNTATAVARIAPASLGIKPVPASQVGTNAGAVIPLMVMDEAPLAEAIAKLAAAAGLKVALDPKWAGPSDKARTTVSFRWEKLTARQALAALLDNHDLILVEDAATSSARIVVKMQRGAGPAGKSDPGQKQP